MSRRRFKAQRIRHNDLGVVSTDASTSQPTNLQYLPVGMAAFVDFQDSSKGIENHGFYAGHRYSYLSVRDNLIFAELPGFFYNAKPKSLKSSLLSNGLHDPFLTIGAQRVEPKQQFGLLVPDGIKVGRR